MFLKSRTVAEMIIRRFDLLRVFNADKMGRGKRHLERSGKTRRSWRMR